MLRPHGFIFSTSFYPVFFPGIRFGFLNAFEAHLTEDIAYVYSVFSACFFPSPRRVRRGYPGDEFPLRRRLYSEVSVPLPSVPAPQLYYRACSPSPPFFRVSEYESQMAHRGRPGRPLDGGLITTAPYVFTPFRRPFSSLRRQALFFRSASPSPLFVDSPFPPSPIQHSSPQGRYLPLIRDVPSRQVRI